MYVLLSERAFLPAYSIWDMYILEKDPELTEEEEGLDTARSDWLTEYTEHFA